MMVFINYKHTSKNTGIRTEVSEYYRPAAEPQNHL